MSKEKVFVIDGPNVHYVVNPNTEEVVWYKKS